MDMRLFSEELQNEYGILKPCHQVLFGQDFVFVVFPNKCSNSLGRIDLVRIQELDGIRD